MPPMSSARFFADTLKGYGVTHVFMVPAIFHGGMVALEDTGIRRVTAHHEVAATYMADGYARAARRPGIVMAQSVGAANVAAGLRDAYLSGSPVIALTGGPHPDSRYRYLYQVIDDLPMFQPVTRFNAQVDKPERLPDLLRQAFRSATVGAPRPVHLEFPGRLGEGVLGEIDSPVIVEEQFSRFPAFRPEAELSLIQEAVRLLSAAERPVIVAGGGVLASDAAAEVVKLAEVLAIPVTTSLHGKGTIPENHPLAVGALGSYGRGCSTRAVEEADLVFFVGTRAGGITSRNWCTPRPGTPVIQLDIDPVELGRNYPARVSLSGDAQVTLRRMAEMAKPVARPEWLRRVCDLREAWRAEIAPLMDSEAVPLRPERICREVAACLPDNAVLVSDTGHAAVWTANLVDFQHRDQRYLRCAGTLGWAFPASLGVKCALPDRPVLCFTGDGGLFYHLGELETAARMGINVVVLVNNNRSLQQVRGGLEDAYGGKPWGRAHEIWMFRDGTNFARIAEEMGCLGLRVERPEELRPALERAFAAQRPVLVDVVSDIDAMPAMG